TPGRPSEMSENIAGIPVARPCGGPPASLPIPGDATIPTANAVPTARRITREEPSGSFGPAPHPSGRLVVVRPSVTGLQPVAGPNARPRTDSLAVASAVCGLTAVVPIISQLMGLCLGAAGLARIRRAKRAGRCLRGTGWAITGIVTSGVSLIGWIALFVGLAALSESLTNVSAALDALR
ncbi:MAG: DUF4190 domain-containing protein, partial [Phycisphaerae bacterium]